MADTGWKAAGAGTSGTPTGGTTAWTSPGNIVSNNNVDAYAVATAIVASKVLRAKNFGFAIPTTAVINGIEVRYESYTQFQAGAGPDAGRADRLTERLIGPNGAWKGDNKSDGDDMAITRTVRTLGGPSDLWGATWTPADINDPDFGFGFQATLRGYAGYSDAEVSYPPKASYAYVDYVQIKVYYTDTPAAPTGVTASYNGTNVTVTWNDNASNESDYEVARSVNGGSFSQIAIKSAGSESHTDSSVLAGNRYHYRVRARITGGGNSAWVESNKQVAIQADSGSVSVSESEAVVAQISESDTLSVGVDDDESLDAFEPVFTSDADTADVSLSESELADLLLPVADSDTLTAGISDAQRSFDLTAVVPEHLVKVRADAHTAKVLMDATIARVRR